MIFGTESPHESYTFLLGKMIKVFFERSFQRVRLAIAADLVTIVRRALLRLKLGMFVFAFDLDCEPPTSIIFTCTSSARLISLLARFAIRRCSSYYIKLN